MCYCWFFLLCLSAVALVLKCSYTGFINSYNFYVFFLDWSLDHYVISFLISYHNFIFYFIWYEYRYFILWYLFAWNIFFPSFPYNPYVSLCLKWVFCKQDIHWFCFWIPLASLYLLFGTFKSFIFKVTIDIHSPIIILLIFLCQFCGSFSSLVFPDYKIYS